MRDTFLPFALPEIDEAERSEVLSVLESGWLTTGPKAHQFEREFAEYVGVKHAIAVNSCTAAMHLALDAIGLKAGDEVVTTPYTFAATAEVIRYFGARPSFVDVEASTLTIDPTKIESALTSRTRAVIAVDVAGLPARLHEIREIAQHHGLYVIEDAAHALPAKICGRLVGGLSDVTCFSFYATKTLTTGEGGMICTNVDDWEARCRMMSLHGISRDAWNRYSADGSWFYEIQAPGYKYNLTDIAAALGIAQLRKLDRMWARRAAIAACYTEALSGMPELEPPLGAPPDGQHAWHLYMLRLHLDRLAIGRAEFITELKRHNIGASVHFIPLHVHPYYRHTYGYQPDDFPVAHREYLREVSLPIYSRMSDEDVKDVIAAVGSIVRQNRR